MRFTACVLALLLAGAARAATVNVAAGDVAGLVSAVQTANANPGPDIVELSAGATYTLTVPDAGSDGLPAITSDVTIHGHGATIARAGGAMASFRLLEVGAGSIVHRLESRNGKRKVGEAARNDIAGQANPIQADMKALQKSL